MYLGEIVEEGNVDELFERPLHPYTQGLLKSIPIPEESRPERLHTIKGNVPTLEKRPKGCVFSTRCPYATKLCMEKKPELISDNSNQKVKCHYYQDILRKEEQENATNE